MPGATRPIWPTTPSNRCAPWSCGRGCTCRGAARWLAAVNQALAVPHRLGVTTHQAVTGHFPLWAYWPISKRDKVSKPRIAPATSRLGGWSQLGGTWPTSVNKSPAEAGQGGRLVPWGTHFFDQLGLGRRTGQGVNAIPTSRKAPELFRFPAFGYLVNKRLHPSALRPDTSRFTN